MNTRVLWIAIKVKFRVFGRTIGEVKKEWKMEIDGSPTPKKYLDWEERGVKVYAAIVQEVR